MWDSHDRVWLYNSDDGHVFFWDLVEGEWVKVRWDGGGAQGIGQGVEPPPELYPPYYWDCTRSPIRKFSSFISDQTRTIWAGDLRIDTKWSSSACNLVLASAYMMQGFLEKLWRERLWQDEHMVIDT